MLSSFYEKYGIKKPYSHWLKASFRLKKSRIFLGGVSTSMPVGRIEVSIKCASFLEASFRDQIPDFSEILSGEGIFNTFSVYPCHTVKPFTICFNCSKKELDSGEGYFFCRTQNFQLCQKCGFIEITKRENPKICPPFMMNLYFKLPSDSEFYYDKLMILSQEDFNPEIREKKHSVRCVICENFDFQGIRFKCAVCSESLNVEICERCAAKMIKGKGQDEVGVETLEILNKAVGCPGMFYHPYLTIYLNNTY